MLVDSHCHLNFPDFANNIDDVVNRAIANDVTVMQNICTKISELPEILSIAEKYDNIWCSVGIHPHNVKDEPDITAEQIIELTKNPKVIGIGETGFDYHYEHSPRKEQKDSFIKHINASRETGLPLIVHTREADDDTIDILQAESANGELSGLIHCFSSSGKLAYAAIELGMYISVSGIITFKKANELQDIVKDLPLDRLLVETDAPFLAPIPYRGKTNEPAFTKYVAESIAKLKGITYEEVADATTRNFFELFGKATGKSL